MNSYESIGMHSLAERYTGVLRLLAGMVAIVQFPEDFELKDNVSLDSQKLSVVLPLWQIGARTRCLYD